MKLAKKVAEISEEGALHIVQPGQPEMPGMCHTCSKYLLKCTRPGVLECPDYSPAHQA